MTDGKHEDTTKPTFLSQLGTQAKKAYAGGVAGAAAVIATLTFSGILTDGAIDGGKIATAAGAVVTGFVGGFLAVFLAPKNHPAPTEQTPQPAWIAPDTRDLNKLQD